MPLENQKAINHLKKDKVLRNIIKKTTLNKYSRSKSCFNSLVKSIVSQQLSVKAAASIYGRFELLLNRKLTKPRILQTEHEALRSVGLSNSKANYIHNVARFFTDQNLSDRSLRSMPDQDIIKLLTEIKGVGVWTVQMMLIFQLERPDVFPIGDLEVKKQMIKYYQVQEEGKEQLSRLEEIAAFWSPYRSLASIYMWSAE